MTALVDGQRVEQYRVVRWIGNGLSGESYEVEDTALQRKATLKLLHPWARLPETARRQFFREMQGISILTHPYIATVFDYGETTNALYIVRRYVSPGSLLSREGRDWFRPPLKIVEAVQYAHQIGQALQYIHNQGYFHGALTFANILVLRGSNPNKEPDFAPFLLADIGTTHFIRRFGKPLTTLQPITAAPEQFQGHVTAASDQYALATLLFFWLTGHLPFTGSPEEIEHLKLTETLPSPLLFNPALTFQQEGILRRALNAHSDERYPSILAFTKAFLHSLDAATPPPPSTVARSTQPETPLSISEQLPQPDGTTTQTDIRQDTYPSLPPVLIVLHPAQQTPRVIPLEHETITLGRAASSDILLDLDDNVSRHHALLQQTGDAYTISDQRSTLGVYVNGKRIADEKSYPLQSGDQITMGEYSLIFQSPHRCSGHQIY
jgi:serine/threonine protein kinase